MLKDHAYHDKINHVEIDGHFIKDRGNDRAMLSTKENCQCIVFTNSLIRADLEAKMSKLTD